MATVWKTTDRMPPPETTADIDQSKRHRRKARVRNNIEEKEEKREEEKKKFTPHSLAENVAIVGEKQQIECRPELQHV